MHECFDTRQEVALLERFAQARQQGSRRRGLPRRALVVEPRML